MVLQLVNALVSVLLVSGALVAGSMRRQVALVLALGGTVTANFLFWVIAPDAWATPLAPWACSVVGVLLAGIGWSFARVRVAETAVR